MKLISFPKYPMASPTTERRPLPASPTVRSGNRSGALAGRLRLVVTRLARRLRQEGAPSAVSPTGMTVLASVARGGALTLGELAAIERVQPPTVTGAVNRLLEQGFVTRHPDPVDRRVARIELTATGRRFLDEQRTRKQEYLDERLRTLSADELATLEAAAAILERLLEDEQ